MWTFRRNEKDVVNLYNSLSDMMKLATEGDMLNFGYWDEKATSPLGAQKTMCSIFGKFSQLDSNQKIIDVGSGFGSPAIQWNDEYGPIEISCVNVNYNQLQDSINLHRNDKKINFLNSTATILPFQNSSVDRIIALESAHHFKPLNNFFSESFRILKKDGILALAIPILTTANASIIKLGILSMTWSSEHYSLDFIESLLKKQGFEILEKQKIGSKVYVPLANYYIQNRDSVKLKIKKQYPSYAEKILFKSICKMKDLSQNNLIDYLIMIAKKNE